MVFAQAKPRPEAELDGVGICEVAAVVPHPLLPSTGPPDHSPKLFSFPMGNPVSVFYGLDWPSFMEELRQVVMVSPASIGPTEAHLYLVIIGDDEPVRVNNAKVPWHDGWENRQTYEQVGGVQSSVSSPCIGLCVCASMLFSVTCSVECVESVCGSLCVCLRC